MLDTEWIDDAWTDATTQAAKETGIELVKFPEACPWAMGQVLGDDFLPE